MIVENVMKNNGIEQLDECKIIDEPDNGGDGF